MREPIRIILQPDDVAFVRERVGRDTLVRELAALAGSLYLFGGRASYMLSRFEGKREDTKWANLKFIGSEVAKKEEVWEQELLVKAMDRRKGYVYLAIAVSPVIKGKAAALICGYTRETDENMKNDFRVPYRVLIPAMPIFHQGVTDAKESIEWINKKPRRPWAYSKPGIDRGDANASAKPEESEAGV